MKDHSKQDFQTKCVHAGIDENEFGAVVPPIYQTSTFKFLSIPSISTLQENKKDIYIQECLIRP